MPTPRYHTEITLMIMEFDINQLIAVFVAATVVLLRRRAEEIARPRIRSGVPLLRAAEKYFNSILGFK